MLEFLQANWFWLLLGAGAIWILFRGGGCGMSGYSSRGSESSRTKAGNGDEEQGEHVEEEPRERPARRAGHGCC